MPRPPILLDSRSRAAVAIVFSEPDLALDPANCVRRSHCSVLPDRFVPHPRSSSVETFLRRPELSALNARCGKGRSPAPALRQESGLSSRVKDVQCVRLSPLVVPAADGDRVAKGLHCFGGAGARVKWWLQSRRHCHFTRSRDISMEGGNPSMIRKKRFRRQSISQSETLHF